MIRGVDIEELIRDELGRSIFFFVGRTIRRTCACSDDCGEDDTRLAEECPSLGVHECMSFVDCRIYSSQASSPNCKQADDWLVT